MLRPLKRSRRAASEVAIAAERAGSAAPRRWHEGAPEPVGPAAASFAIAVGTAVYHVLQAEPARPVHLYPLVEGGCHEVFVTSRPRRRRLYLRGAFPLGPDDIPFRRAASNPRDGDRGRAPHALHVHGVPARAREVDPVLGAWVGRTRDGHERHTLT